MPKFQDLVNLYVNRSDDNPLPEDFAQQLETAYNEDISVRDSAVDERTQALAERDTEIGRLKSHNYDLLRQIPTEPKMGGKGNNAEDDDDNEYTGTIDDLFKKKG